MSQENVSDKVRNLQRQIAQGIKFGQRPPSLRKSEGDEGSSDEEEVPRSPLKVLAQVEAEPANTEPKQVQGAQQAGPHSPPVKSPRSKRVLPPTGTIESINLDAVPQSVPRLDNTAAKHKLSVKPKNQRISRKHRRFTQDLQEVSIPGVVQEDLEAAGVSTDDQRRVSVESLDGFKKQRLNEEDRQETRRKRELEEQRLQQEEEERRKRAAEELRLRELEEEMCRKQREEEERKLREEAERRRREEEESRIRDDEERRRREEEERSRREEEERRMREEQERRQQEEELRRRLEEQRRKEEEEEEARRQQEIEEEKKRKQREEEQERRKKEEAERLQEIDEKKKVEAEERRRKEEEEQRRAEELRWREMEERQRPFSFKVSSGEKQILFQKVNLTPVTPASSHQSGAAAEQRESAKASSSEGPDLPTSPYVPHTAILVTGAQLCGTAVNLDQIKDTACKSLLGLGEDRKAQGTPPTKSKTSPDRKSGKTKSLNESSLSTDQSVLAEWASIRSKIFKGVEEGKYDDNNDPSKNPPQSSSEDTPAFSHTNLRKTMSASAKFSITPAKKKFGDSNRNSEVFGVDDKESGEEGALSESPVSPAPTSKPQTRTSKTVRIVERGSEECMFAKDLPSFLVPCPKPEGPEVKSRAQSEAEVCESREEGGDRGQDGEDKPSPFGIKLRRTNYSLRFHSDQSTEKRKKRYSAGDSFDGVPSPLTPIEPDSDTSSVFSDKSTSPTSPQKEGAVGKYSHASASPAVPRAKPGKSTSPTTHSESEKVLSKPPLYRRPTTSPKPSGAVPTPPPSPLPKGVHGSPSDAAVQRTESCSQEQTNKSEEPSAVAQLQRSSQGQVQGEEEPKEKRSFFPSINIPWREKGDRKAELIKREKPSLQSRHSLDSARVQEKEAGPLWITLALQKQKGFREQQQNREDRRSQREAKLAEKQARERDSVTLVSPTESRGSGSTSPSSKPQTPEEPKRPDSLLGRFERREHLKKANTLPSSVTVEIADSTPSPPAVKEVSKRFPSSDSPQVSTEPAWLALAKRKAKAWSDCPQIIK
ncbi:capping protein inhibiting regulator of actin dynamics isoform X2 [Centropristis striata]|nr:capping protein inhibiting regulator of actin dynamics isoform X2 [Centropristis striata]XP_059196878.1 capping protein inhibiting regulator of actin dynamics isoform X2 [Centropristis striata]